MLIAPVTPQLLAAMVKAHDAIKAYDAPDRKRSDKTQYSPTADVLEVLTVATLSATSALTLIKATPIGARFNFSSDTGLARQVTWCVTYLRGDASALLSANDFSAYDLVHTARAMDHLRNLYQLLTGAIMASAKQDLSDVLRSGPEALVHAAEVLSSQASAKL